MKDDGLAPKDVSKSKAIEAAVSQIEKQFGKGAVMKLGQRGAAMKVLPLSRMANEIQAFLNPGERRSAR